MAAGRHNLTRRALLVAAAGVPFVRDSHSLTVPSPSALTVPLPSARDSHSLTVPSPSTRGQSAGDCPFSCALAAFRRAEARLAAFRRYEASLPAAARAFPACKPLEERGNELESARLARLRRLLQAPAPDLPALALKVGLAVDDEIAFYSGGDLCLAAVKADAQRLCGGSPKYSSGLV
jgi:hypothetical protein